MDGVSAAEAEAEAEAAVALGIIFWGREGEGRCFFLLFSLPKANRLHRLIGRYFLIKSSCEILMKSS